jgi:hypothetical protein
MRLQIDQFFRKRPYLVNVAGGPTNVHVHAAAVSPTQLGNPLCERGEEGPYLKIVFIEPHQHADPPDAVALLRPCRQRPQLPVSVFGLSPTRDSTLATAPRPDRWNSSERHSREASRGARRLRPPLPGVNNNEG